MPGMRPWCRAFLAQRLLSPSRISVWRTLACVLSCRQRAAAPRLMADRARALIRSLATAGTARTPPPSLMLRAKQESGQAGRCRACSANPLAPQITIPLAVSRCVFRRACSPLLILSLTAPPCLPIQVTMVKKKYKSKRVSLKDTHRVAPPYSQSQSTRRRRLPRRLEPEISSGDASRADLD
jgi:hypothetical protein